MQRPIFVCAQLVSLNLGVTYEKQMFIFSRFSRYFQQMYVSLKENDTGYTTFVYISLYF
jgi:hypothetical protein